MSSGIQNADNLRRKLLHKHYIAILRYSGKMRLNVKIVTKALELNFLAAFTFLCSRRCPKKNLDSSWMSQALSLLTLDLLYTKEYMICRTP